MVLLEGDYCKLLEWLFVSLKLETKNIEGNLRVATRFTIFLFVVIKHKDRVYNLRVATSQQFTNRWTKSDVDSSRLGELRKLGHKTK